MSLATHSARVDHIPVVWVAPEVSGAGPPRLLHPVIWLPGFGGNKEGTQQQLQELASAGYLAISFDPWQHGERAVESREELGARILSNIRRHFWPILARTAEEVPRILDFAVHELGASEEAGMGGDSMGGDIAVAAVGVEPRLRAVATRIATPDWLRPGSFEPPGQPDAYALRCYSALDPLTHTGHFAHGPAISFQCGAEDRQVPADGALRFQGQLKELFPSTAQNVEVVLHPGVGHSCTPAMWDNCMSWFARHLGTPASKTNS